MGKDDDDKEREKDPRETYDIPLLFQIKIEGKFRNMPPVLEKKDLEPVK